ncbi:MAG: LytTR family DNA-binding domain-containing protein [Chitinophagales bacterium]
MIRTIIVDDEFPSLRILENFLMKIPACELVAKCSSPDEAMEVLKREKIDLMFLDIQMPGMTGIEMLSKLETKPVTIIITANNDKALDAFNLDVVDYVVKPFSFDRFNHAVDRAKAYLQYKHQDNDGLKEKPDYMMVRSDYKVLKIFFKEIKYIEGFGEYVKIMQNNGQNVITLEALKNLEKVLPKDQFLRIHKSYIINTNIVHTVSGNVITTRDGKEFPVGKVYRDTIRKMLRQA